MKPIAVAVPVCRSKTRAKEIIFIRCPPEFRPGIWRGISTRPEEVAWRLDGRCRGTQSKWWQLLLFCPPCPLPHCGRQLMEAGGLLWAEYFCNAGDTSWPSPLIHLRASGHPEEERIFHPLSWSSDLDLECYMLNIRSWLIMPASKGSMLLIRTSKLVDL